MHWSLRVETVTDFLIELGMKTRMDLMEISNFSLNNNQTYQYYEQPPRAFQNSDFSVLNIGRIFPIFFCEEYWSRRPTFIFFIFFLNFDF